MTVIGRYPICVREIRLRPPAAMQPFQLCRRLHTAERRLRGRCPERSRAGMHDGGALLEGRPGNT